MMDMIPLWSPGFQTNPESQRGQRREGKAKSLTFAVNSSVDAADASPGDGVSLAAPLLQLLL